MVSREGHVSQSSEIACHNLTICKCHCCRTRQEAAAVSGVVPHLVRLAAPPVCTPLLCASCCL